MTFDLAVQIVLMKEGGLVDHPDDGGLVTKYGISKRAFPNEDIANLTLHRAKVLYKKHYWDLAECDDLPPWLRLIVFDCAVNQGVTRAVIFLQRILKVPQDGILGPQTLKAIKNSVPKDFLAEYTLKRFDSYKAHPQWHVFGKGWAQRLFEISLFSMKQAPDELKERLT